jgi:polyvinyl alcohol dehydrogenase (cytochrome)
MRAIFQNWFIAGVLLLWTGSAVAVGPDGSALFGSRCEICHSGSGRASKLDALSKLSSDRIYEILTTGMMKPQSAGLSDAERRAISEYIGDVNKTPAALPPSCSFAPRAGGGKWNGWSPDLQNTRFQPAAAAGLKAEDVPKLKLKWALVMSNVASAANQVSVVGGRLYLAGFDGAVYALDPQTGCLFWTFHADAGVRAAITVADGLAFFGDFQANVYAVNAATGKLRWKTKVYNHPNARITGSPRPYGGLLYVPVASLEEGAAADPMYQCCNSRGSVVALRTADGKEVWRTYTVDEPLKQAGVNKKGVPRFGPAGVSVWSAVTLDPPRNRLYVATGNTFTDPPSKATDAVIAMNLKTGTKIWQRSLRPRDAWNGSCMGDKVNCPDDPGPDYDFGSNPVLTNVQSHDLLLAGQKSGVLFALDPDKDGKELWEVRLGKGNSLGGIEWGFASDGKIAYVPIADWDVAKPMNAEGSLNAVDLKTGTALWHVPNPAGTCKDRPIPCSSANAGPLAVIPGIVFSGSLDGYLRAHDAATGKIVWQFDTYREFTGINGIQGHGGGVNAAGPTIVNGMVFQTSGYGAFGLGMPGNVLLAFAPAENASPSSVATPSHSGKDSK